MSRPLIFGMVHLRALPGTPRSTVTVTEIVETALKEAEVLFQNKCDGIIIENMHDVPYQRPDQRGPETVAIMTKAAVEIRRHFPQVGLWSRNFRIVFSQGCQVDFMTKSRTVGTIPGF